MPLSRDENRAYQADLEADMNSYRDEPTPPRRTSPFCPAATGRPHDFSMVMRSGNVRCWHCCKTREQVERESK